MGYYLGIYAFDLPKNYCFLLAGICAYLTMIVEVLLFIIKGTKSDGEA